MFITYRIYIYRKQTHEPPVPKKDRKDHKVKVSNPKPGPEKRQCTLQVAFSPVPSKMRPCIIFRGTGKRISRDETDAYHPDVDVYWQTKAWADTRICIERLEKTLEMLLKIWTIFFSFVITSRGRSVPNLERRCYCLRLWFGMGSRMVQNFGSLLINRARAKRVA